MTHIFWYSPWMDAEVFEAVGRGIGDVIEVGREFYERVCRGR